MRTKSLHRLGLGTFWLVGAFALSWVTPSCGQDDQAPADTRLCPNSVDCGAGLRCEPGRPSATRCQLDAGPDAESSELVDCRIPRTVGKYELVSGFGVDEFDMTVESPDGSANVEVTWLAPDDARFVTCALFSCLPEFSVTKSADIDVRQMDTFDRCVLAIGFGDARRRQTTLAKLESKKTICAATATGKYCVETTLEQLSVGCWAYDDIKVIAATRLEAVSPLRSFVASRFASDCAVPEANGKACIVSDEAPFGTCHDKTCLARCLSADDCAGAPTYPRVVGEAGADADDASDGDAAILDSSASGDPADSDASLADAGEDLCRHTCVDSGLGFGVCQPK